MRHLFVYGTLREGEPRWPFLQPFVIDAGAADRVAGHIYDTGLGYPAATFHAGAGAENAADSGIVGQTFELAADSLEQALSTLDEVEGAVRGLYRRVEIMTGRGIRAWAYEYGTDPTDPDIALTPISGGDWLARPRPVPS